MKGSWLASGTISLRAGSIHCGAEIPKAQIAVRQILAIAPRKRFYNRGVAVTSLAGVTTLGNLASTMAIRPAEAAIIAELKAGSEEAYASLIGEFHQPIYALVHRVINDPSDAADTTQEVFLKVFRGMKNFHGESSLKTWIYRIAIHEASNRRRWWFRHKAQEVPLEPENGQDSGHHHHLQSASCTLLDRSDSPFDAAAHEEVRLRVEEELRKVAEPFRTAVVLRDLEGMAYDEIADILQISLGTVKSRLTRGREILRQRLAPYIREVGGQLELTRAAKTGEEISVQSRVAAGQFEAAI